MIRFIIKECESQHRNVDKDADMLEGVFDCLLQLNINNILSLHVVSKSHPARLVFSEVLLVTYNKSDQI